MGVFKDERYGKLLPERAARPGDAREEKHPAHTAFGERPARGVEKVGFVLGRELCEGQ